jgi:hypothetical protein
MISHNQTTYEHIITEGFLYIGYFLPGVEPWDILMTVAA